MPIHNEGYEWDQAIAVGGWRAPALGMRSVHYWATLGMRKHIEVEADGVTDVTEKIQAAISAARSASAPIYFPPGTYAISDTLLTATGGTLAMVGAGRVRSKFLLLNAVASPVFSFSGSTGNERGNIRVEHLGFDSDDNAGTWFDFLHVIYTRFSHLLFSNVVETAIEAEVWWDSQLRDCDFISGGTDGIPMVWLKDLVASDKNNNNIVFDQCRFETLSGTGVKIGEDNRKNSFIRCKWDRVKAGLVLDECFLIDVLDGSHFTHCGDGIIANDDCEAIRITDCTFDGTVATSTGIFTGAGATAVNLGAAPNCIVTNNFFSIPEANGTDLVQTGVGNIVDNNIGD